MTEQVGIILQIEVEINHVIIMITKTIIHKTDIALHLEINLFVTERLFLHKILVHDMTTIKETLDVIVLVMHLLVDHHTDFIPTQETIFFQNTHTVLDLLQDQEFPHLAHGQTQETKLTPSNLNHQMTL